MFVCWVVWYLGFVCRGFGFGVWVLGVCFAACVAWVGFGVILDFIFWGLCLLWPAVSGHVSFCFLGT